jgi:hypothetical protein
MTTSVFSIAQHRSALVCQLQDLTPSDAIAKLAKAGIIALEGPERSSIVLIGFSHEISLVLADYRRYGYAFHRQSRNIIGKLKKLSLAS